MKLGHDTLIGAVLIISGLLTFAFAQDNAKNLRIGALAGACATAVIGALLLFGLI